MERKIPEKFLEFDEKFNGKFVEQNINKVELNMKALIIYCRENDIDTEKLSSNEIKKFELEK